MTCMIFVQSVSTIPSLQDDIYIYISEKLTTICSNILEHLDEMKGKAKDDTEAKYYVKIQKNFIKYMLYICIF